MRWVELNTRQLQVADKESVCILPIGAIEQHGPHLPLATDLIIAESLSDLLDEACGLKLLVLPSVAVSCSDHHLAFAGTLSLDHATLQQTLHQIVRSAARHGFQRFFLLNAHGGNIAIGSVVAETLARELPESDIVFATWFRVNPQSLRPLVDGEYPAVGHACEFETSILMALRPELVDREAIADDGQAPAAQVLHFDLLSGGPAVQSVPFERITRNGVWGKPSFASAEKGKAILDIVVPSLRDLLAAYWPQAPGIAPTSNDLATECTHDRGRS